jgi:multiple sugar transport system ATP-binding protein
MNLRTAGVVSGGAQLGKYVVPLNPATVAAAQQAGLSKIIVGIRPESFHVAKEGEQAFDLHVNLVEELGADAYVYGTLPDDNDVTDKQFIVRFDGRVPPRIGEMLKIGVRPGEEHAFNPDTGERIGGRSQ